jgi:integrase
MGKSTAPHRRPKGEGAIYETSDGRLRGSVLIPHPNGDGMVRRYVSGRSRADVSRRMEALRRDATAGYANGETTGAYLARWIVAVRPRLRPATHHEYVRHVRDYWSRPEDAIARLRERVAKASSAERRLELRRRLEILERGPYIDTVQLVRLTPTAIEKVMAGLVDRGLSPMTVQHARSTLRRAIHDAQRDGLVTRNVAALARPPRADRREMHALSPAEVARMLEGTADDPLGPVYAVAVGTGLRLGELLGLEWTDVDLGARQLTVRRAMARARDGGYALAEPKTGRSRRTVMLPSVAGDALRRQKARQAAARLAAGTAWQDGAGLVFTDPLGRPLRPDAVSAAFRATSTRLGLGVRLHDLRHTAASLMLAAGVPLKVVSETLGHSSIAITADVYAHVTPDLRREAADAMDRALSGGAS